MRMILLAAALACPISISAAPAGRQDAYGILLLAHGGNQEWNAEVASIARALEERAPTETALGMAHLPALQAGVDALQKRGAKRIVAVPLFIHSRSEVLDQTRYNLGLREKPSEVLREAMGAMAAAHGGAHHGSAHGKGGGRHEMSFSLERVKASVPISMTAALDDSREVAHIAAKRAAGLSKDASKETVLLVGHGPVDDAANEAWLATMGLQAERVKKDGGYKAVKALTIRDDNKPEVKGPALQALRDAVMQASRDGGRAIVVPYLIARGGIESHVTEALKGLDYAWDGKTLLPDPVIEKWAASRVLTALKKTKQGELKR